MTPTPGENVCAPPVRRVLMTADAVGGVWSYSLDLGSALRQQGIEVTLAVLGSPPREQQRAEARRRGITMLEAPFALEWMPDGQRDFDAAGAWLLELAARTDAELVHLNGFSHAALPWCVPVVVVAHSCVRTWWRAVHGEDAPASWDLYTDRVAAGLRAARLVVAPTAALLAEVRREYGVIGPSSVIPNGSAALDAPRSPLPKKWLVFSAGRLWDDAKNIDAVCSIAPHLSWPVYLAGEARGPSGAFVASGGVRHLGRLAPDGMAEWYARASIYALPARYEPFGLSVVEAAAAGCALVLGDIRSLRENWSGAAVFVPPDNRRAIASAIEELIRDGERRDQLGRLARARAERFTINRMAEGYLAAYAGVLAAAAAA